MNDLLSHEKLAQANAEASRWHASLSLDFTKQAERSFLAKRLHTGPLVIQKTLHPEGEAVCHGIIVHPPGGVAGGDALTLNVGLEHGAHALLTTPGAGKWYKANGHFASQHLAFNLKEASLLEWLPQENILFDGAEVKFSAEVYLSAEANYAGWEILCFGRQAQNEIWKTGGLHQNLTIYREVASEMNNVAQVENTAKNNVENKPKNKLIWQERTFLKPEHRVLQSMVGLYGNAVSASFVVAAGFVPPEILAACKALQPKLALDVHAKYGVTALPEIFVARYVGQSAQSARQYFEQLWQLLRPWYAGREAVRPRIWNT